MGYHIRAKRNEEFELKIDLFYTENFIFPIKQIGKLRMADEREIAAMKMLAIGIGAERAKDYWDIHELLEDYTITDMIRWGYERNQYTLSVDDIVKGLKDVTKIEPVQGLIKNIKDNSWSFVQKDICNALEQEQEFIENIMSFIEVKENLIINLKNWGMSRRTIPTKIIIDNLTTLINHFKSYQDSYNIKERTEQFINDELIYKLKSKLNREEIQKITIMLKHELAFLNKTKGVHL